MIIFADVKIMPEFERRIEKISLLHMDDCAAFLQAQREKTALKRTCISDSFVILWNWMEIQEKRNN